MKIRQMGMYDGKKTFKQGDTLKIEMFSGDIWTGMFQQFSTGLFGEQYILINLGEYKHNPNYETKLKIKNIVEIQVMR